MVVRKEALKEAILNVYNRKLKLGMEEKTAWDLADYLLSFFGYDGYALDNILEKEDRSIFYEMEAKGILQIEFSEEIVATRKKYNGGRWRVGYWRLLEENINKLANPEHDDKDYNVYNEVPDDAWNRMKQDSSAHKEGTAAKATVRERATKKATRENAPQAGRQDILADVLHSISRVLSPDVKPIIYLSMEPETDYTSHSIASGPLAALSKRMNEGGGRFNINSMMESLVSLGLVSERTAKNAAGVDVAVYRKIAGDTIFDAFAALAIRSAAGMQRGNADAPLLVDIFSYAAGKNGLEHSRNLFGLLRKLNEDTGKGYKLCEIQSALGDGHNNGMTHTVKRLAELGMIDYSASASDYYVPAQIEWEALLRTGAISGRGRKPSRLGKAVEFINFNVGSTVDRKGLHDACGADEDNSSKYLTKLARAGLLERRCEWNSGRTSVAGNSSTASAWKELFGPMYSVAEWLAYSKAGLYESGGLAALAGTKLRELPQGMVHISDALERYRSDRYALAEDAGIILDRYLSAGRRKSSTEQFAARLDEVLGEQEELRPIQIRSALNEKGEQLSGQAVSWHLSSLVNDKKLIRKDDGTYSKSRSV